MARTGREGCSKGQIRSLISGAAEVFCFCAMSLNHHFDNSVTLQMEDEQGGAQRCSVESAMESFERRCDE